MQNQSFTFKTLRSISIALSLIALNFYGAGAQQLTTASLGQVTGIQAEVLIPGANAVTKGKVSNVPEVVHFKPGAEVPYSEFANWFHKNLKLSADYDFKILNEEKDSRAGYTSYRYQQTYKGIPVEGTMYILHVKDGNIYSMTGQIFNNLDVDVTTSLAENDALSNALAHIGAQKYAWQDKSLEQLKKEGEDDASATYYPRGELVLVAKNGKFTENNFSIAYKFDVYSSFPKDRRKIFVDAKDGSIANEVSEIENTNVAGLAHTQYSGAQNITCDYNSGTGVYSLMETGRGKGIITYNALHHNSDTSQNIYKSITSTTNAFDVGGVIDTSTDAHWGSENVYDFYLKTFNRNSLDGNGIKIINMTHVGHNWQNADWNGTFMEYGDGCGGVWPFDDIVTTGHEMTHGVTQFTADLIDANGYESGALNEGFSDIFGVSVQQFVTGSTNWAEAFCGVVQRNLINPTSIYDNIVGGVFPDTYEGRGWDPKGEVHHNSTIVSHWFYLLSQGGSGVNGIGNAYGVTGLGMSEAELITYTTLTKYLTPNSGYVDTRELSIEAATDLYGAGSNEVIQVTNAWYAVGVGGLYNTNFLVGSTTSAEGLAIAHDKRGNVYVAGSFNNTLTLGNFSLSGPSGPTAAFVAKFDSNGNVLWAVQGGGSREADAAAIAVDKHGNAYVTGTYTGGGVFYGTGGTSVNFPIGKDYDPVNMVFDEVFDAVYTYVAAYDSTGKLMYCVSGGETNIRGGEDNNGYSGLIRSFAITCDDDSDVFIGGIFDFGETKLGNLTLTNTIDNVVQTSFIAECRKGTFTWGSVLKSNIENKIQGLALDGGGYLYATGEEEATSYYKVLGEADSVAIKITNPGQHPFIMKMTAFDGDIVLQSGFDGPGTGSGYSISVIKSSNPQYGFVFCGTISGQLTFGGEPFTNTGGFIADVTNNNQIGWEVPTKGNAYGVSTDWNGHSYVTGTNLIQEFDYAGKSVWDDTTAIGTYQCNAITVDSGSVGLTVTGFFDNSFSYNSQSLTASGQGLLVERIPVADIRIRNKNAYTCISLPVNLRFQTMGNFYSGNVYTAQLSDTAGKFTTPIILGSKTSHAEFDSISFTLPSNLIIGKNYSIRVVSTVPMAFSDISFITIPEPNIKATLVASDTAICGGKSITLTASRAANYKFLWYMNGTQLVGDTSNIIAVTQPGTYKELALYDYVVNMNSYSCMDTAIVVIKGKAPLIVKSPVAIPCDSSHVTLHVSSTADNTYTWSPPLGLNSTSGATVVANPTTITTYTVTGTDNSGCQNDTTVIVHPKILSDFFISPGAATVRCDSSVILNAVGSDSSYTWAPADGLNFTTGPQVIASPTVTTTYTVTGTTLSGCTSDTTIIVTVIKSPIGVTPATIRCDSSAILTANGSYEDYSWAPPKGLSDTSGASVTANPTITSTYTVTGTSTSGCKGDTTVVVTVTKLPISITPATPTITCDSSVVLTITSNLTDFTWAPDSGLDVTSGTTVTASPITTTTYSVTGTTTSGCSSDTTVKVIVKPGKFSVATDTVSCDSSVYMYAIGHQYQDYIWDPIKDYYGGGGDSALLAPVTTTTFTVTGSNKSGCRFDTTAIVIVKPILMSIKTSNVICDSSVTLTVDSRYTNYTWSPADGLSATTGASVVATITETTTYFITGTTDLGCSGDTSTVVTTKTPVPEAFAAEKIKPTQFTAEWDAVYEGTAYYLDVATDSNFLSPLSGYNDLNVGLDTDYVVTNLKPDSAYYYRVRAATKCGTSDNSDTIALVTLKNGCQPPTLQVNGKLTFCVGDSVILDAGPDWNSYTWNNDSTSQTLVVKKSGQYYCHVTNDTCDENSDTVTVIMKKRLSPAVSIFAAPGDTICLGRKVTFTADPDSAGTEPTYQWTVDGKNVGANQPTYSSDSLRYGDTVRVIMTADTSVCDSPSMVMSDSVVMFVKGYRVPFVSILTDDPDTICEGTAINLTARLDTVGSGVTYQWMVDGKDVGKNDSVYVNNSLDSTDYIYVVVSDTSACDTTEISDSILITVHPHITPSVTIKADMDTVCKGSPAKFTATPDSADAASDSTPSYQWKVNGFNVGIDDTTFTDSTLNNGDDVTVEITSKAKCASPTTATSNAFSITVTDPATPMVNITASPGDTVCSGMPVTFTANPQDGGDKPKYQWKLNGSSVGADSSVYTNTSPNNGDTISLTMTSSEKCVTSSKANSNKIVLTIGPPVTPSVTIKASADTICSGTFVTFTATSVNGGVSPSYQWMLNGNKVGTSSPSFTSTSLSDNDQVSVVLTSSLACVTSSTATSNAITMTVNTSVTPSVSITETPGNAICSGTSVTFSAAPVNGGTVPSYQWKLNGNNVGADSIGYTNATLSNGDNVTVVMTSNATCVSPATATGNTVKMTVSASTPGAPVAVAGSGASGSQFTANWDVVSGTTSYYLDVSTSSGFGSFISGFSNLNVGNVTSKNVTGLALGTVYYYRVRAGNGCGTSGNSNVIADSTANCPTITGIIATPDSTFICSGSTQTLSVPQLSGVTYQWQVSANNSTWANVSSGGTSTYTTLVADGSTLKYYRCLITSTCLQASSSTAIVNVSQTPVVTASNVTANSVTVSWTPYISGQYNLTWQGAGADSGRVDAITSDPYIITGLGSNENVTITVAPAGTSCGSVNSGVAKITTLCAAPSITGLTATPKDGFTVTWTPLNGITAYRVYYRNLVTSAIWSFVDTTGGTTKTILGLTAGQTYAVYIQSKNCPSVGKMGEPSTELYVTINPLPSCTPPPVVSAVSNCQNQITVNISGGTAPYSVTFEKLSPTAAAPLTVPVSGTLINTTVGSSNSGSVWQVFARSNCGSGNVSSISNIATVIVSPTCQLVANVIVSQPTCTGFTASWNSVTCNELSDYILMIKKSGVLNYSAYPVGLVNTDVVNWLSSGNTYNVAVEATACNGTLTGLSTAATVTLTSVCREEESDDNSGASSNSSQTESVAVYPNPSTTQFFVDLGRTDMSEALVKIELINQLGQVMQTDINTVNNGHLIQLVNVGNSVAPGIYFVRTSVNGNTYVNKIMLTH